jgi:hypothetical protein
VWPGPGHISGRTWRQPDRLAAVRALGVQPRPALVTERGATLILVLAAVAANHAGPARFIDEPSSASLSAVWGNRRSEFPVPILMFVSPPAPAEGCSAPVEHTRCHPRSPTPHAGQASCGPESGARALLPRSRLSRVGA